MSRASVSRSISSIISETPDRSAVSHIVEVSHRLALSYLIKKVSYGSLRVHFFGLDLDDLALDCIADLFQRSDDGRFNILDRYFRNGYYNGDSIVALRRLVFSKVNENLFRRYHESDANLSRIIRNIKDSVKLDGEFRVVRYRGQQWLVVSPEDEEGLAGGSANDAEMEKLYQLDLPVAPPEILESVFAAHLSHAKRVRDMLVHFRTFLNRQTHYARGLRLIAFAQVVRSAYRRIEMAEDMVQDDSNQLLPYEIERAVGLVTERLKAEKHAGYVGRGKVDDATYHAYFSTIRSILSEQFLYDADPDSYYTALLEYLPGISESQYMHKHRNILEYLAKLARTRLTRYLKDDV